MSQEEYKILCDYFVKQVVMIPPGKTRQLVELHNNTQTWSYYSELADIQIESKSTRTLGPDLLPIKIPFWDLRLSTLITSGNI